MVIFHSYVSLAEGNSGWWFYPSWKIWVRQWEGWHPIYEMEKKKRVWNHQPELYKPELDEQIHKSQCILITVSIAIVQGLGVYI